MKREYLGWVVAAVVVIVVAATGAAAPDGQIGRFQAVAGRLAGAAAPGVLATDVVVLLDTTTGKSWTLLIQSVDKTIPPQSWSPVTGPR